MAETWDVVVIGAGPGGAAAAEEAARRGAKVALIERDRPGGTCLNWGCIPTKTMLATAEVIHRAGEPLGLTGSLSVDWPALQVRRAEVIDRLVGAHMQQFKKEKINYIKGTARLAGPGKVQVEGDGETQTLAAKSIILATGSRPGTLRALPTDGERVLNSDHALMMETLPKSLAVIGGGVIGCEFASLFHDLGVEVTLIESQKTLLALAGVDDEVKKELGRAFKKRKIKMHLGTVVEEVATTSDGVTLTLANGKTVEAERALVSIGRTLNADGLGLDSVGLAPEMNGGVTVDENLRTKAEGVYAIGDLTGQTQLAHWAMHQGIQAARHALGAESRVLDPLHCPSVVFTRPCVGWVGLSEVSATAAGHEVITGMVRARALGKAHATGELDGLTKLVAEKKSGRLLGAHVFGHGAEDQIAGLTLAVRTGLTLGDLADTIHPHPTMSEGIWEAAREALRD